MARSLLLISTGELATGFENGVINVWETVGVALISRSQEHTGIVASLVTLQDINYFASGSTDRTIKI